MLRLFSFNFNIREQCLKLSIMGGRLGAVVKAACLERKVSLQIIEKTQDKYIIFNKWLEERDGVNI